METDEARKFAKKAARTRAIANETVQNRQKHLAARRASYAKSRATERGEVASVMSHAHDAMETNEARKFAGKAARATARATETDEARQKRLADRRAYYAKSRAAESGEERQKRLDSLKAS